MKHKDPKPLWNLNTDDAPEQMPVGDVSDALNVRMGSSSEQHGKGTAETLQGEVEVLLGVSAPIIYYGAAIGGEFIYSGFDEVTIGNQTWMKRNYDAEYPGSKTYNDDEDNVTVYGRLYNHAQIMEADFCPSGWRIPTEADIDELLAYLGGAMIAGGKLKEAGTQRWLTPNTSADDESGFRGLPGGKYDAAFSLLQETGLFWLADDAEPEAPVALNASNITPVTFKANWRAVTGASGYKLDVSTSSIFASFVAGYEDLDIGNVVNYTVNGLTSEIAYYYRVRAYNEVGDSANSNTITLGTTFGVIDFDGNVYNVVTIGAQQWLVENFRCEHYIDGTAIPIIEDDEFTDWFLPSKDEVAEIRTELYLHGIGDYGWNILTSSEVSATNKWVLYMTTGAWVSFAKGLTHDIIPIRVFTDLTGSYSLRDEGPAGGYIFHINGTDCYEAYPSRLGGGTVAFSNIVDQLVGTGTAIGTGQANTTAIIGQVGHTDSAAKLCDDLSAGGWINDTTGAMCYYDNDETTYKADYGALYNWYAVDNAHGLGIAGWRVPSVADFSMLISYLGGSALAGGKLKEIGLSHWNNPNIATDDYGFSARAGGNRIENGIFIGTGNNAYFYASDNDGDVYSLGLVYSSSDTDLTDFSERYGFSIRLMRDLP